MNGINRIGIGDLGTVGGVQWDIAGTGDFNGDSQPDIFWRKRGAGEMQVWYLAGFQLVGTAHLVAGLEVDDSTGWAIGQIGDFDNPGGQANHDGKPDIFWHNEATGESQIWYMDGINRTSAVPLDVGLNVMGGWHVVHE